MAYSTQGWVLIAIAILAIIYIVVHQFYTRTSRELKRLESLAKSPLFAQFVESLTGITTIRAYGLTDVFLKKTQHLLDTHLRTLFAMMMASRWLSVRLELLGALVIFSCSIFVVAAKGTISPATGGLALSYSLSITAALAQLVTQ
jgi:ATP-binding cassette subfamily C (CFTR/MRP) protein 1